MELTKRQYLSAMRALAIYLNGTTCLWLRERDLSDNCESLPHLFVTRPTTVRIVQIYGINVKTGTFIISPQYDYYYSERTGFTHKNYTGDNKKVSIKCMDVRDLAALMEWLCKKYNVKLENLL